MQAIADVSLTSASFESGSSSRATTSDEARLGLACRFNVTIDGHSLGGWAECSGLEVGFKGVDVPEGGTNGFVRHLPGPSTYKPISLKRAMTTGTWQDTMAWLADVQQSPTQKTATITLNDAWGDPVASWTLYGAYPLKWTGPSLTATDNKVAVETLELTHEGFLPETKDDRTFGASRKAYLVAGSSEVVEFDFNPSEIRKHQETRRTSTPSSSRAGGGSASTRANMASGGGRGQHPPVGGQAAASHQVRNAKYDMQNLIFDGPGGTVQAKVNRLFSWMEPRAGLGVPPVLTFRWGQFHALPLYCTITQCQANYTKFDSNGTPTRAKVNLTLTELPQVDKRNNPTSGGSGGHRSRILAAEESLASIAFEEYGDPDLWRRLGRFNRIEDPARLVPGTRLRIPTRTTLSASRKTSPGE